MEYLTTSEIAKIWGITARRVQILCKEGRIEGAFSTTKSRPFCILRLYLMRPS